MYSNYGVQNPMTLVCEADMLLQGMVGGWAVIEASHTVSSGLNVTCHMLTTSISSLIYCFSDIYLLRMYMVCSGN